MLVEFSVTNFLSIQDKATLSLVKGSGKELAESNSLEHNALATPTLLASAAIYGPNGAGKSNLIKALSAMYTMVLIPPSDAGVASKLPVEPFLLDDISAENPTEFEIVFIADEVRYQYGFSATTERIHEEWLYVYPKGKPQRWIERAYDAETGEYAWGSMDKLSGKKQKRTWQDATRPNALFLTTAVQLNSKSLLPVVAWFLEGLSFADTTSWLHDTTTYRCEDAGYKSLVEMMLRVADTSIEGIEFAEEAASVENLPSSIPYVVRMSMAQTEKDRSTKVVKTRHTTTSGQSVPFLLRAESRGTQKLYAMAGYWLEALKEGRVLIVDELHDQLHPHLSRFLVMLFHDKRINTKNAQLVFTTHDASLLSQDLLRRDQIWFIEKDDQQNSKLYPLSDFSPRKNTENLERGYLGGRYGALPNIQDLAEALGR